MNEADDISHLAMGGIFKNTDYMKKQKWETVCIRQHKRIDAEGT